MSPTKTKLGGSSAASVAATFDSNGVVLNSLNEPLISSRGSTATNSAILNGNSQEEQQHEFRNNSLLEDDLLNKDLESSVYKSTIDKVEIIMKQQLPLQQQQPNVGLTKEDLACYVNDPKWRKIRFVFLGLFWLCWFLMFAIAIVIVFMSPKCPPKPQRLWWQRKTCYQIWTRSFKDSDGDGVGDLNGISERLKYTAHVLKASAIWPIPLLKSASSSGYDILDHRQIDPALGTLQDFDNMVETAHQKDMYVIMDLPLTTVNIGHDWFKKSSAAEPGFENFFHWRDRKVRNETWSSVANSARPGGSFYRHWGSGGKSKYVLLNWDEPRVRKAMEEVATFWLKHKVDGFYLGEVQYMSLMRDDSDTANWDKIHDYLRDFNAFLRNNSNGRPIVTFTSGGFDEHTFGSTNLTDFKLAMKLKGDIDYVINNELVFINQTCRARCLYKHLDGVNKFHMENNVSWPMWEIGQPYSSRIATRMGSRARGEMISLLMMTLPGSVNILYGDEIGMVDNTKGRKVDRARSPMQWDRDELNAGFTSKQELVAPINDDYEKVNFKTQSLASYSTLKMFKRLATLRQTEDAILYGRLTLAPVVENHDVLVLNVSSQYGSKHHVTILNFGPEATLDLTASPYNLDMWSGREAKFVTSTTNVFERKAFSERDIVDVSKLTLKTDEAIVLRIKK